MKQKLRLYCLVHEAIEYELSKFHSEDSPNAVLIGDARMKLHYDSLNRAFQLCMDRAPLIATGRNRYFKTEEKLQLDSGAFVTALERAAGIEAVVVGKPGREFYDAVVRSTNCSPEECLRVGEDVEVDIIGALDAGLRGVMVRTGKYQLEDEDRIPEGVTVIGSVVNLFS